MDTGKIITAKMKSYISPNYTYEKLENPSFDDLVDVFEDRVRNFMLIPVEKLLDLDCGFMPAMQILFSYFESIQIYITGKDSNGKSEKYFTDGFFSVFEISEVDKVKYKNIAKIMYREGRCGFFHDGMSRKKILYSPKKEKALIVLPGDIILINHHRFFGCVKKHFDKYISDLRNTKNVDLRECFRNAVKIKWSPEEPIVIGMTEEEFLKSV